MDLPQNKIPGIDTLAFWRSPEGFLLDQYKKHGDASTFNLKGRKFYALFAPEMVYEVTNSKQHSFVKGMGFGQMRKTLGHGLFTSEEPLHMKHRRMIQPGFHHSKLDKYVQDMVEITREHIDWVEDARFDLADEISSLTLKIVSQAVFGVNTNDLSRTIRDGVNQGMDAVRLNINPFRKNIDMRSEILLDATRRIIEEHKDETQDDFIGLLLSLRDEEGNPLSDQEILDETISILLGGYETTSSALVWAFSYLIQNPDFSQRLEEEADSIPWVGEGTPSIMDTAGATNALNIFHETVRLSSPVWSTPRRTKEDVTIRGIDIPERSDVMISQYVTHRNPDVFMEPERWDPDRWVGHPPSSLPHGSYFPFGGGSRLCIGKQFALAESVIIMLEIAKRWRLHSVGDKFPKGQARLLYRPKNEVMVCPSRR